MAMRIGKRLGQTYQTASLLVRLGGDGFFDPSIVVHRGKRHGDPEGWCGLLDRAVVQWGDRQGVRVENHGDPRDIRRDLLEQLQPFCVERRVGRAEPSYVAAGPSEALNKALANGIA